MSDVAKETSSEWQRWQIALAIGIPVGVVTIATGCIIYYWWKDTGVTSSPDRPNKSRKSQDQDDPITAEQSRLLIVACHQWVGGASYRCHQWVGLAIGIKCTVVKYNYNKL